MSDAELEPIGPRVPTTLDEVDQDLVRTLQAMGEHYGPMGLAQVAAMLTDIPALIRWLNEQSGAPEDDSAGPPLDLEETLAMAEAMATLADKDAERQESVRLEFYWDGWAAGLRTLLKHQRSGVKVTCFPPGSCACHPLVIGNVPAGGGQL